MTDAFSREMNLCSARLMPGSSYLVDTNVLLGRPFKAQPAHGQCQCIGNAGADSLALHSTAGAVGIEAGTGKGANGGACH